MTMFQVLCERCFTTQDVESEDVLPLHCNTCSGFGCFVGPYVAERRITGSAAEQLRRSRFYAGFTRNDSMTTVAVGRSV